MTAATNEVKKEFRFTDKDFYFLSRLVGERVGIDLPITKRELVYGRLAKRLRKLGLKDFREYCALLEKGEDEEEFVHFINSITTNVTSFFRENHHFEYLKSNVFPEISEKNQGLANRRLRIWSAGCSSGKEPYSIAIVLRECIPDLSGWDARILATDLDSNILETAKQGVYPMDRIKDMSKERQKRWFRGGKGEYAGMVKVSDDIRRLVSFKQLNLMERWPMKGPFDIIFCRNVTIYFDHKTRTTIIDRFADMLSPGGYLFVGHSESLFGLTRRFESVGRTIHRKIS